MASIIQLRRGLASLWTSANPILAAGEQGFETDTQKSKYGNGSAPWNALPYTGIAGPSGPSGPAGPQGPTGPAGTPASLDGTGWSAYTHTGAAQALLANTKVSLANNAGTVINTQKPSDIASFYDGTVIPGRLNDGILMGIEFTYTPSSGIASQLELSVDIGAPIGELYAKEFGIWKGSGVAHKISYSTPAYMGSTWVANGGTLKVISDGPGSITQQRYVFHRIHKGR